ncbi:MAG: type II secretion system protein [Candidatus Pacebacteria bacterium]|nr:type II secretion system protein [Candidatus Paceibacterota bacterium]
MIKKIFNLKFAIRNCKAGFSYVELIVVLSIFATLSSVVIFNYGDFQDRVDIKNLASDIALKIVEAQKSSTNGVLPLSGYVSTWKPAYGVYFDTSTPASQKQFIYFADLNNDFQYNESAIDTISITKNNFIYEIDKCTDDACSSPSSVNLLSIVFKRPDSSANFYNSSVKLTPDPDHIQIIIKSPKGAMAYIKIYPSGRVQVN